jgi:thiamine biosynthesis lipoprotein
MRKPRIIALTVSVVAVLALAAFVVPKLTVSKESSPVKYKGSYFDLFDTYSEITAYAPTEAEAEAIVAQAHTELLAYHQLYDIYNDYEGINNLKTVNDNAGVAPVAVDERILNLVAFAKDMDQQTGGRMNVAMGSVLSLWHEYREAGLNDPDNAELPPEEALAAAAGHTDIDDVIVDADAGTVYLTDPDMSLDVGAVAKGYAVEQVAQALIADGVADALLSIGGNVRAIGTHADGTLWHVNIQNPDLTAEDQSIATLGISDLSVVTSGSYQRYYTVDGKTYCHIIDPDTLYPAEKVWAVSVTAKDSGVGDALSTALFTLSVEDGEKLLESFPDIDALWVDLNGNITHTDDFTALTEQ